MIWNPDTIDITLPTWEEDGLVKGYIGAWVMTTEEARESLGRYNEKS